MKSLFGILMVSLALLWANPVQAQAKLLSAEVSGIYEMENYPTELSVGLRLAGAEQISVLHFSLLNEEKQLVFTYSLARQRSEEELYFSDGDHKYLVFKNSIALSIPIAQVASEKSWSFLLISGEQTNGLSLNTLLSQPQ